MGTATVLITKWRTGVGGTSGAQTSNACVDFCRRCNSYGNAALHNLEGACTAVTPRGTARDLTDAWADFSGLHWHLLHAAGTTVEMAPGEGSDRSSSANRRGERVVWRLRSLSASFGCRPIPARFRGGCVWQFVRIVVPELWSGVPNTVTADHLGGQEEPEVDDG